MENFDLKAFLNEYDIRYKERGKNVSKGWINIETCPFCGNSAYHLGINLSSLGFHCWVCGEGKRKTFYHLLREMDQFKGENFRKLIDRFKTDNVTFISQSPNLDQNKLAGRAKVKLPEGILSDLPIPHRNYLEGRGYDPDFLKSKYRLMAVYNSGTEKYRFRIIAPVFINKRMVSFIGAAIVRANKNILPYLNASEEESIIPIPHCLYNYDTLEPGGICIIVEGLTDVWRMGDNFLSSFRKDMTDEQISLLLKKQPRKTFIMYDADAEKSANAIADDLDGLLPGVELLLLNESDPADLSFEKVQEIRRDIFGTKLFF